MITNTLITEATNILKQSLGNSAEFRNGQWEAISSIVQDRKKTVVVQRTGWGKSLVYFVATRLNRQRNYGMTILISPLLALMRNQIEQAEKFGLVARRIDSTNADDHPFIQAEILQGKVDILFISPERLGNETFHLRVWSRISSRIGLLVIDEVHCISDWGHDFRPDYRRVMNILNELPSSTPILGTTATANTRVIEDVKAIIGGDVEISRGSLMRESLSLYTFPEPYDTPYRMVLCAHLLKSIDGTGIIYCTTTKDCEILANWLKHEGFEAEAYHSRIENREELEQKLIHNELKVLVASVALGMGFDKPDLSFVIHFQLPGSIISYYQQIGRAGRGIDNAYIILMHGSGDREIQEYFIESAFPDIATIQNVATTFQRNEHFSKRDLQIDFNLSNRQVEKIIQHLEIEGFVTNTPDGYVHTGQPMPDFRRWNGITEKRYQELEHMERFANTKICLMRFLAETLEDTTHPETCGKCKNCRKQQSKFVLNPQDYSRAQSFLFEGEPIWIEPRKTWMQKNVITRKTILEHINEPGLALSYYNDDGWGKHIRAGKYELNYFDDNLVEASARLIERHWSGQIEWITNIPSMRHPNLVADFAQRLARMLGLPYMNAVRCIRTHPEQKTMANSYLQLINISNSFEIHSDIPHSPVLLVDDIVDSRWSLTYVGWLLREQGVSRVFPFALAQATGRQ